MPRIPPSLIRRAFSIDKLLPPLLPVCRDFRSAQNELKWLRQHVEAVAQNSNVNSLLFSHVSRRARGEPLQHILGSEFFGDLEIKCRPGVLIPRQDTAASIINLVRLISKNRDDPEKTLALVDICTGSGCIPLLFHHEFYSNPANSDTKLDAVGIDISKQALELARENVDIQIESQKRSRHDTAKYESLEFMEIIRGDALEQSDAIPSVMQALEQLNKNESSPRCDILISNPPYISAKSFRTTTARSVRIFEPKLALVPKNGRGKRDEDSDGDMFYPQLLNIAEKINAKIFLFEVADIDQAIRVASLAVSSGLWDKIEIWRDEPASTEMQDEDVVIGNTTIRIRGAGNGRSVVASRGSAVGWIGD